MSPSEIQKQLKDHNLTQKALARQIGKSEMSVSVVVRGLRISDYVMRGIADAIGQDVRNVFPWYYNQPPKRRHSKVTPPVTR